MRHLAVTRQRERYWRLAAFSTAGLLALCLLGVFLWDPEQRRSATFDPVSAVPNTHPLWNRLPPERYLPHQHSILLAAWEYNLDPDLIRAVILIESRYDHRAVSPVGASGLMQIMPATAGDLGLKDLFDPHENIMAGARYLRMMLDWFDQNLEFALAAYNAGPGTVMNHGGIPPFRETGNYVDKVMEVYTARDLDSRF